MIVANFMQIVPYQFIANRDFDLTVPMLMGQMLDMDIRRLVDHKKLVEQLRLPKEQSMMCLVMWIQYFAADAGDDVVVAENKLEHILYELDHFQNVQSS